jgi:hypothetical protein
MSSFGRITEDVGLTRNSFLEDVLILKQAELGELFLIVKLDSIRELSIPLKRIMLPGEIVIGDLFGVYSILIRCFVRRKGIVWRGLVGCGELRWRVFLVARFGV